jgi:hypothetical protein
MKSTSPRDVLTVLEKRSAIEMAFGDVPVA